MMESVPASDRIAPAYAWTILPSVIASALCILTQACDAALLMLEGTGVPCRYKALPNGIFTLPIGFHGPGGVTVSFLAQ
jgi:hypothetical protein